jgi:hypothetical protein
MNAQRLTANRAARFFLRGQGCLRWKKKQGVPHAWWTVAN